MKKLLFILFTCACFSIQAEATASLKQIADERKTVYEQKSEEEKQAEIEEHVAKEKARKEQANKRAWQDFLVTILSIFSDDMPSSEQ